MEEEDVVEAKVKQKHSSKQASSPSNIPIIIRPALKRACCEDDACRAAIYNQLLYSIAHKVKSGGEYWYGTQKDIHAILDHSWGLSKVIKEVNMLADQGFIIQRRNPKNGYDQTRQYLFGKEEACKFKEACKKADVCVHQMGFGSEVLHLLDLTNAFVENNDCICQIQQIDSLDVTNPFSKSNDAIPKNTTKSSSKNTTKSIVSTSVKKSPAFLANIIQKVSRELKDWDNMVYNLRYAQDIFEAAGADEMTFRIKIDGAWEMAKQAQLDQLQNYGYHNQMHYFFCMLRESLHGVNVWGYTSTPSFVMRLDYGKRDQTYPQHKLPGLGRSLQEWSWEAPAFNGESSQHYATQNV